MAREVEWFTVDPQVISRVERAEWFGARFFGEAPMQLVLTATQDAPVQAIATDAKGNPAAVQSPKFTSSDEKIVKLKPDASDPMKTTISAVGPLGSALITFTADADLGEGVQPIIGTMDVVVNPGEATVVELKAGPPVEQSSGPGPFRR